MKTRRLRTLTILFPLVSVLVAVGIVWHQCARLDRLTRELAQTEREFARLEKSLPKNTSRTVQPREHHHDDGD